MNKPCVSIIIPVYNVEQFLPNCIDSVLGQSFADFELLLIDDGSTDGSGAICDVYAEKDDRVRVFHKENGGASSARNVGLDNAVGEWVTFVDSDDYILDNYFSIGFEDGIDLYVQNWRYADETVKDWYEPCIIEEAGYSQFLQENVHVDMFRMACCSFFKSKILNDNNIRFDTRFKLGEDTLFVMDYYKYARSIRIVGNSCYIYNRQDNWNNKYCLSWEEAVGYLDVFMDRYDSLPCESMPLLGFMFTFVQKMMNPDESRKIFKWATAKPVLRYKKKQLPYKGIKYRIKYYFAKAISVLANV